MRSHARSVKGRYGGLEHPIPAIDHWDVGDEWSRLQERPEQVGIRRVRQEPVRIRISGEGLKGLVVGDTALVLAEDGSVNLTALGGGGIMIGLLAAGLGLAWLLAVIGGKAHMI